jgi:TolA-binding protein
MSQSTLLKENLLAQIIERGLRRLAKNSQVVVTMGATLLVACLLTVLIVVRKRQADERAWQMFAVAQSQAMQGQTNQGIATLNDLIARFRSSAVLEQTYQLLGSLYMATGNPQSAVAAYEEGLKHTTNENNKPLLMISLAAAYEDQGNLAKAIETHNRFLKEYPDHFLVPRALLCLVRIQSINKNIEAARESYEKLLTLYPDSAWAKRAGTYLQVETTSPAK